MASTVILDMATMEITRYEKASGVKVMLMGTVEDLEREVYGRKIAALVYPDPPEPKHVIMGCR